MYTYVIIAQFNKRQTMVASAGCIVRIDEFHCFEEKGNTTEDV